MRIFTPESEQRAYDHERLKEWRDAGLLSADKYEAAKALAGEAPSIAAWPLRVLLFGFSAVMLGTFAVLMLKDSSARFQSALTAWFLAALAVAAAETIVKSLKVRRFGAEEALVWGAAALVAYGMERALSGADGSSRWHFSNLIFCATLAAVSTAAYARYGYRAASIGAAVALGIVVGSFDYGERTTRVLLALLYAGLLFAASWWPGLSKRESSRLEIVRFFLALSVPLCLNLRLERLFDSWRNPEAVDGAFAWATFVAIYLIPAAWLAWGARTRSRVLIWAGGIGLLVAQCSMKPYLGLARHTWDLALLGAELMILALVLKRWLDSGPDKRRGGFSSESLGNHEPGGALGLIAGVAAASPAAAPSPAGTPPKGGGGSFGGGGASGSF